MRYSGSTCSSPVYVHFDGSNLTRYQFNSVLLKTLQFCGPSEHIRSHSFRIGGASELSRRGVTESKIKRWGRWNSNAYSSYIRLNCLDLSRTFTVYLNNFPCFRYATCMGDRIIDRILGLPYRQRTTWGSQPRIIVQRFINCKYTFLKNTHVINIVVHKNIFHQQNRESTSSECFSLINSNTIVYALY